MKLTTLKVVPSGEINIAHNGMQMHLQFNCSCEDAMPFCGGMCCAYRPSFNVDLLPEEKDKFNSITHPHIPDKAFMNFNKEDGHCVEHMQGSGKCFAHNNKPCNCKNWHCSPAGVGTGIINRSNGWLLFPTRTTFGEMK